VETKIHFELSKEYLDRLNQAIDEGDVAFVAQTMHEVNPADISEVLEELEVEAAATVLNVLSAEVGAVVVSEMDDDDRNKLLKTLTPPRIAEFINLLDSDDAVDILSDLPLKVREQVIASLENPEKEASILDLLRYEDDCAGGLMAKELIKCNLNWKVSQCIEEIRRQAENVQKIYSVYVVDDQGYLKGRIALKRIILADDNRLVADLYDDDIIAVETYLHEEEVAAIMRKYDLEAVPVVNVQGKLLGRITIDDVVDVMAELAEQERQLMSGISEDVEEDDSVWMLSRARLPWLIIGMAGGLLGAQFIGLFEKDIALIPAMAFFIPLITATGGNVGIQSSSIVVQSLANRDMIGQSLLRRLLKVLVVALVNGLALSLLVFGVNFVLGHPYTLAGVVSIALFSVVLLASFMGTITPLILDKLGINPALASGPFITTANDLIGLAVYFGVAHLLYNL